MSYSDDRHGKILDPVSLNERLKWGQENAFKPIQSYNIYDCALEFPIFTDLHQIALQSTLIPFCNSLDLSLLAKKYNNNKEYK